MSTTVLDNIGLPRHQRAGAGGGAAGAGRDAALVIEDGRVAAIEDAGAAADERIDAAGRCVIPGFVDSHTHLVFAGDRSEEFAARMAGQPYEAGGIRVSTEATRRASDERARGADRAPGAARGCGPGSPTRRSSPATGSTSPPSGAAARSPPASPTTSPSSAPTSCRPSTRGGRIATSSWSAGRCSTPARRRRAGSTSSASGAPSTPSSPARCSKPGDGRDWACGSTATSSARAPEWDWRSSSEPPRWITAPTSPTPTSRPWPARRPSPPSSPRPTSPPASRIPTLAA